VVHDPHRFPPPRTNHFDARDERRSDAERLFVSFIDHDDQIVRLYAVVGIYDAGTHNVRAVSDESHGAHINGDEVFSGLEFRSAAYRKKGRVVNA
jgi:hypothetical protein